MSQSSLGRGVLHPRRLPAFHRFPPPPDLSPLVRWFWVPRWDLPPGRSSRQQVLAFPASNLVIEPSGVLLYGPTTRTSHRDLHGRGWAVGALLRPAATTSFHHDLRELQDRSLTFEAADLHRAICVAMSAAEEAVARERAVSGFADWVRSHVRPPDEQGMLANAIEELIAADPEITRVDQIAEHLNITTRHVQRLMRRHVGLPPLAIIRRYRLQTAVERLREDGSTTISQVAADLGYADHAHLTRDFHRVLGLSPIDYRRSVDADAAQ